MPRPTGRALTRWKLWLLPGLLFVAVLALSGLGVNQSSVGRLSADPASDPGFLTSAGPRAVRSDEYIRSTPVEVGNVRKGLPREVWLGLASIDLDATSLGAPTRSWTMVFRPQLLAMAVVGPHDDDALARAFAFRWWATLAIGILGAYSLLLALRPRPLLAVALAAAVGLAPCIPWWSGADLSLIIGFLSGAGAAVLMAARSTRWWRGLLWAALAGWSVVAAFVVLYPPWLISVGLVVGLVVAGALWDRRAPLARLVPAVAATAVVSAGTVAAWLVDNRAAIAAISGTYYPGQRQSESDGGLWAALLSAPSSLVSALDPAWTVEEVDGKSANLSELSSGWISLPVLLLLASLLALSLVRARRASEGSCAGEPEVPPSPEQWHGAALGALVGATGLTVWALLPLPAALGFGLLDRVPGARAYPAIALGFLLLVHVSAGRVGLSRAWRAAAWASVLAASAGVGLAVARVVLPADVVPTVVTVVVSALLAAALLGIVLGGRLANRLSALLLSIIVLATYSVALPLYRGLGPLTSSPLATYLAATAAAEGPSRWVSLVPRAEPVIAASPEFLLSGMTYYPDASVWQRLAPSQELYWNNFQSYVWQQDSEADPARIVPQHLRISSLRIDLCDPRTAFLGIRYVVSEASREVTLPCFDQVAALEHAGSTLAVWRRTSDG